MTSEKSNYYRSRSEYHRAAARGAPSEKIRELHVELADSYEVLARRADQRPELRIVSN